MATAEEKYAILISQRGCCLYCANPLDGIVFKRGNSVGLELQWDHMIPRALRIIDRESNIVASCQICNSTKNDLVFETVEEAGEWIMQKRRENGYSDQRVAWYEAGVAEEKEGAKDRRCNTCKKYFASEKMLERHVKMNPRSCREIAARNGRRQGKKDREVCPRCGRRLRDLKKHLDLNPLGCRIKARIKSDEIIAGETKESRYKRIARSERLRGEDKPGKPPAYRLPPDPVFSGRRRLSATASRISAPALPNGYIREVAGQAR